MQEVQPDQELPDRSELESALVDLDDALRIYDTEAWGFLADMLRREEHKALNELMLAPSPEQVLLKRERVLTLRYLGSNERRLRDDRARVVAALAALDEGE